jgi:hypothetical protein
MVTEERISGRPARVGVLQAIRRYPLTALIPLIALTALGVALGYERNPEYTSHAELAVGQLNVNDPAAVGSVVEATQSLAAVYSRMIDATGVQRALARKLDDPASISATPIPGSPLVQVTARSDSAAGAIRSANTAARALLVYARRYDDSGAQSRSVYRRFREAALRFKRTESRVERLARAYGNSPTAANERRLNAATADLEGTRLLRDALRLNYQISQQNSQASPSLRSFSVADSASDDRASSMQVLGLLGLIAGAALGAALATFRLNRRLARLTRP